MDSVVFHAPVSRQSPLASTTIRPLFQRDPLRAVDAGDEFYNHHAAPTPTASVLVPPTTTRIPPPPMPVSALLAESIQVALHHSNSDSDHGDNFAPAQTSTYVTSSDSPRRQSNAARGRRTSARRREQCRINLARYRLRQDQKVQLLNDTVTKLREEVPLLELQRDRVLFGTKQSVFNVVVEYFHLFRHGVRLGSHVQDTHVQQQQAFLRCVIASDVRLGERQGLNVQWRRYSSYFEDLNFQLEHVDERAKNLVTVSAFMTVTISEATLKHIFPHL